MRRGRLAHEAAFSSLRPDVVHHRSRRSSGRAVATKAPPPFRPLGQRRTQRGATISGIVSPVLAPSGPRQTARDSTRFHTRLSTAELRTDADHKAPKNQCRATKLGDNGPANRSGAIMPAVLSPPSLDAGEARIAPAVQRTGRRPAIAAREEPGPRLGCDVVLPAGRHPTNLQTALPRIAWHPRITGQIAGLVQGMPALDTSELRSHHGNAALYNTSSSKDSE